MAGESELRERRPASKGAAAAEPAEGAPAKQQPAPTPKGRGLVVAALLGLLLVLGATGYWCYTQGYIPGAQQERIFTKDELAKYSSAVSKVWYLALLGEVFEVTKGVKYYDKGGGYEFFTGVDASRGFVTGKFKEDLNDNIEDLDAAEIKGLVKWVEFYHKDYVYKGKLVGAFYDERGRRRPQRDWVDDMVKKAEEEEAERERQRQAHPDCNMRWSQTAGGEVWCDEGMFPRKYLTEFDEAGGQHKFRCACFKDTGWSDYRSVYPGCEADAHRCKTS